MIEFHNVTAFQQQTRVLEGFIDEIIPEIERVVLLAQGRIVADGPKAQVLTSEHLSALYGTQLRITEHEGWYRCWHA